MARGPVYVAVLTGFLGAQWQRASAELPCVGQWLGRCAGVSHRVCLQPDANQHAQPRATALGFSRPSGGATSAHSLAGRTRGRAAAKWSGLLECPCGTRMIKTFDHHLVRDATPCTHASAIPDAAECFAAAAKELRSAWLQNVSISSGARFPAGCSVRPGVATFNQAAQPSTATCAIVPDGGSCVCRAPTGDINGHRFDAQCYGEPRSELVKETITPQNPACDFNLDDGGRWRAAAASTPTARSASCSISS